LRKILCDDVVIEQVTKTGTAPMLVPKSIVHHLRSMTLQNKSEQEDLTWQQVDIFNQKYGQHKFENDPRFLSWKLNRQG